MLASGHDRMKKWRKKRKKSSGMDYYVGGFCQKDELTCLRVWVWLVSDISFNLIFHKSNNLYLHIGFFLCQNLKLISLFPKKIYWFWCLFTSISFQQWIMQRYLIFLMCSCFFDAHVWWKSSWSFCKSAMHVQLYHARAQLSRKVKSKGNDESNT